MKNEPRVSCMPENKGMFPPTKKKKKKRSSSSMEVDTHLKDIETKLKDF